MSSTTDHVHERRDQTTSPSTDTQVANSPLDAPHEREASFEEIEDALHPAPQPTLLEALRDTYLATAHTVTQVTQDAERMEYPQFRARLLGMAVEDQGHVTWLHDTLLARGGAIPTGACPPTVAPTSWAALLREMAAARL